MPPAKVWNPQPTYFALLEILNKKGDMPDDSLFDLLKAEYDALGFNEFNQLLLRLEVSGKIRTTSMARGKRRVELIH
jgi:hypothetical protein